MRMCKDNNGKKNCDIFSRTTIYDTCIDSFGIHSIYFTPEIAQVIFILIKVKEKETVEKVFM